MREARWLWALTFRRWRRLLQRFVTDASVRKRVMTASFGLAGGCLPMVWFLGAVANPGKGGGPEFPEAGVFGVALMVVWLILLQPALSGSAIILPRPGLSLILGGPITGRGLIAWWASRAWFGMAIIHAVALGWVSLHLYPGLALSSRWSAVLAGAVLAGGGAMALVALGAATHHRLPRRPRNWVRLLAGVVTIWLGLCGLFLVLDGDRSVFLPDPYHGAWFGALDATLAACHTLTYPAAAALAAPSIGAMHGVLAALVAALAAAAWRLAPGLDVTSVLEASTTRAEAQAEVKRTTPKAKRRAKLRRFGQGATALVWKAMAETEVRHGRFGLIAAWLVLAAIGAALGWGMQFLGTVDDTRGITAALLGVTAIATGISCMVGGSNGMGLASEVRHPTWLTRYPVSPAAILLTTVGVPAAGAMVVLLVLALPPLVMAGPHRTLVTITLAAALAINLAVRGLRTLVWLRFPPGPGSNTLTELLLTAAFVFPIGVTGALAGTILANEWLPPVAAVALAGSPCMVIAGLCWPGAVRLLRRMEMR